MTHYDYTQQPIKPGHMAIRRDGSLSVVLDDGTGWVVPARYQPQGAWGPSRMAALRRALYEAASIGYRCDDGSARLDHVAMCRPFASPKTRGLAALGIGMCSNPRAVATNRDGVWIASVDPAADRQTAEPGTYVVIRDGVVATYDATEGISPAEVLAALDRRLRDSGIRRGVT